MLKAISLIGLPGSGKSACGRILAQQLNWSFIDTDEQIEGRTGQSIPELFKLSGESYFRQLETDLLRSLAKANGLGAHEDGRVIATGGGLPVAPGNFARLSKLGAVVYLEADIENLVLRLKSMVNRPLLKVPDGLSEAQIEQHLQSRLTELLSKREKVYNQASIKINTCQLSPSDVANKVMRSLGLRSQV